MNNQSIIISAVKTVDGVGCMAQSLALEAQIMEMGLDIHHLLIEPLSAPWAEQSPQDHFKSGCAPVEALARAKQLINQGTKAVLITGQDNLKTGYQREQRLKLMQVYQQPLTQLYTDLAQRFIHHHDIDAALFKRLCEQLFENYKRSYRHALSDQYCGSLLPDKKWYNPITELFRGVDCANPLVDFSGRVLVVEPTLADALEVSTSQRVSVEAVGLSVLDGDGPQYIDQIADYQHLKAAYQQACDEAGVDFAQLFRQEQALLETYTCYPVVPMAFLLVSGLVDVLENMPEFLRQHSITVTGGMNLARAAWNNPALNGIISMVQRMTQTGEPYGLIHANGGLGYRQGVAILAVS